jgi:hypothetical protein
MRSISAFLFDTASRVEHQGLSTIATQEELSRTAPVPKSQRGARISPIEAVGCAPFPLGVVQSDSTKGAFTASRGAVRYLSVFFDDKHSPRIRSVNTRVARRVLIIEPVPSPWDTVAV